MNTQTTNQAQEPRTFRVTGQVRFAGGIPASGMKVIAYDRDLRSEQSLGEARTDKSGAYRIEYSEKQLLNQERGTADLVVKALDADGSPLVASPVLFNAPQDAVIDLTIAAERKAPPPLFERIGAAIEPLLGKVQVEDLEEDQVHQDLTFLSGETGFEKSGLARFVLAHRLAARFKIDEEFWFALLGGPLFQYAEQSSLRENLATVTSGLPTNDAGAVRKTLAASFNRHDIPAPLQERTDRWLESFLELTARRALGDDKSLSFVRLALEDAGIKDADKQAKFARLFNEHKTLKPELLAALAKDQSFQEAEIADLRTSYRLAELTGGDFSVVKVLKEKFNIRQPKQIRTLAKLSEHEWDELFRKILPDLIERSSCAKMLPDELKPKAQIQSKVLESRFREAFPTAAFAGGLERALRKRSARGIPYAKSQRSLGQIIEDHPDFDLLRTPVDEFLSKGLHSKFQALARDETFRLELKAVQRVFKLAPTFEATNALLADGLHSAQRIYRIGESEFVRRYGNRAGFTPESARAAWSRAADTHAAVLTMIGDLAEFDAGILPGVLKDSRSALEKFPNWNNLFQSGDICHCEPCRSVLSPAAYFTDLIMFLRDRTAADKKFSVRDILFKRRPDLGYLELNCENALTSLPYVDVVCEVLERAVAAGENDVELAGLDAISAEPDQLPAAKEAVTNALTTNNISVGNEFTLSQVEPDPNRWVVHGVEATYLLKRKATPNFFAELLPNTKSSAAELRAYPQYVNSKAYDKLRQARFPSALPFDLFAAEVRAAFQNCNLQRWDLMRTFQGPAAPNNPSDADIAAEYFGISSNPETEFDEKRLILNAAADTEEDQQPVWGVSDNLLNTVTNVKTFLLKTGLEYDQLLALLDLPFIRGEYDIVIRHPDASCDTGQKVIEVPKASDVDRINLLDRIHRFLRLWRKLNGWKMWELDLAIRCPGIGLDLINLYYLAQLRTRLGAKTTIEQLCGLFADLNTETRFTKPHEQREDGLYQSLFLNKKLIQPLDPAFAVAAVKAENPTEKISGHRPVILAALGISETDLGLLTGLTRASNNAAYINDDLTLTNLSFLWRHAWLAKLLKFKTDEWKTVLKLLGQDVEKFDDPKQAPKQALEFVEKVDHLRNTGFTPDELNWLLAADHSAKVAMKEADAARFLRTLRTELQAIRSEYDPARYEFLESPSDVERLTALLTTLLQQLHRTEAEARFFVDALNTAVQEKAVQGLPADFTFPKEITGAPHNIPIHYDEKAKKLYFTGWMTAAQKSTLLDDPSLAAVKDNPSYKEAIAALYDEIEAFKQFLKAHPALKFLDPVFTAPLSKLPAEVDFKTLSDSALAQRISYDAEERALRVVGILSTAAEKTALDALSADASYRNAINSLFTQPDSDEFPSEKLWLQDADLQFPFKDKLKENLATAVKKGLTYLSRTLSEGHVIQQAAAQLGLTEALARRLLTKYSYSLLYFDIPMTEAQHTVLLNDSSLPPEVLKLESYQQAIKKLFEGSARARVKGLPVGFVFPKTITDEPNKIPIRCKTVTWAVTLLAHLTSAFADTTGVVDYATLKSTFDGWFWANRIAALWKKWNLTLAELERVDDLSANAELLDFADVPMDAANGMAPIGDLLETNRLLQFRASLPETDISLLEVLVKLSKHEYSKNAEFAEDVQRLNETWTAANVNALIDAINLKYPGDYLRAESWERVRRAFYFIESLNADAATVRQFAAAAMGAEQAKTLKALLRSKFGADTWLALSAEIQDTLRVRKRDALAAYLLAQPKPDAAPTDTWENTNDLYAYYLLDVEMSACQLTSRLVQASGSVQLFVQRCFMGLEPEVKVQADGPEGDSAWRWWQWMRKYRVWEANRKVFLWPENWIEPELKKDRSPFFKDLENELLQNEINQYTVEAAFTNYLEKLVGVAQLEIAGFYQEDDGYNTILHVFGRTAGTEPHLYYYRRYDYRQWTPWEKVDLDIQGDYLIPAVVNNRLFLFWPVFTEVPDEAGNTTFKVPKAPDNNETTFSPDKTKKRLRLQLATSEYRNGKWTPKKISTDFYESKPYDVKTVFDYYSFFPIDRSEIDGRFFIKCMGRILINEELVTGIISGYFEIAGCSGIPVKREFVDDNLEKIELLDYRFYPAIRPVDGSTLQFKRFLKWIERPVRFDGNDLCLTLSPYDKESYNLTVLGQTPGIFKLSTPEHLSYLDKIWLDGHLYDKNNTKNQVVPAGAWLPFFYNDDRRTFLVLPMIDGGITYPQTKSKWLKYVKECAMEIQNKLDEFRPESLDDRERKELEKEFHELFPKETPKPGNFTNDQLKLFKKRKMMLKCYYSICLNFDPIPWLYLFKNYYHPFACQFAKLVYNPIKGIPALMSRETQLKNTEFDFKESYQPEKKVVAPYPQEVVDFSPDGAYSPYNWELFFHAPLLVANALSKNQRFEEARDWYHFIFNPLGVESTQPGGSPMSKYWITKPFYETTDPKYLEQRIENLLRMLAGDITSSGYSADAKKAIEDQVFDWRTNPFEPHRIANYRTVAYQKTVVMKYLDNLIAWGDYLFRQDSMESINEATQLYVLAAEILGPRPKKIPPQARPPLKSFNELEAKFDRFSNALVQVENLVPVMSGSESNGGNTAPLPMLNFLYFCIPHNDKMLAYWDTIADRLYKIRHCMNIEGVVRQLALFEPPIDPGALVKAVAAGVDIGAALADLNAPLPLYRFNVLLQKANEICNDVKALGAALLAALEKKDGEALSLLRQGQEIRVLEAVKAVREKQIEEAKENLEGLKRSKALVESRRNYYRDIQRLTVEEQLHLNKLGEAHGLQQAAQGVKLAASIISILPAIDLGVSGFGGSPVAKLKIGGLELGQAADLAAEVLSTLSLMASNESARASSLASFNRRWDDWKLQENLAGKELDQFDRQIAAAELRIAIAEKEHENHALQIENARAVDEFMRSKYTSQELYQWQVGQISGVYFQSYKLAYDLAKRAERCFRFELGLQDSSFISFGYWDSLKKGLLSGEKLQYDLRRLEAAYLEQNRREFELTKHISLVLLDPRELVKLRETGRCFFRLPEELFDLDYPGHYFRRIKSVSLTLPCVTGPYTTISCTLRLLQNSLRINTNGNNGYPRKTDDAGLPADDPRFVENNIPVKAIATSTGQNDSGVFELNFRDERYLPFEGAGAISEWSLELLFSDQSPDFGKSLRQFDYGTISDVILHIKYTAREDAGPFKSDAIKHLRQYVMEDGKPRSWLALNLRRDFGTQWNRFLNPTNPANGNVFELEMSPKLFPQRDAGKTVKINNIVLLARCTDAGEYGVTLTPPLADAEPMALVKNDMYGGLHCSAKAVDAAIQIVPTDLPVTWKIKVTRPGGGNLAEDQVKKVMEVEDLIVVLGYEWE